MEELIAYVNLNHVVHGFGTPSTKWGVRSSWEEYAGTNLGVVKITKWKGFNKDKSIEIVNQIKKERVSIKENEFNRTRKRTKRKSV